MGRAVSWQPEFVTERIWSVFALPLPSQPTATPDGFFAEVSSRVPDASPEELATLGGYFADRLGLAFVCGYAAALRKLLPHAEGMTALAATESGGVHPRAIETTLRWHAGDALLNGTKSFVTLAALCSEVLVLAADEASTAERKLLRVVRVPTRAAGVSLEELPTTPFAPEIPHYRMQLSDVRLDGAAVLDGDGWADHVRPFRTVEDTFVTLSALGYLVSVARRGDSGAEGLEGLAACLASALQVAALSPALPTTHLALAGVLRQFRQQLEPLERAFSRLAQAEQQRWKRDLPLLSVAERARSARLEKAFSTLGLAQAPASD